MAHIARYYPGLFEVVMYVPGFGSAGTFVCGPARLLLPKKTEKTDD